MIALRRAAAHLHVDDALSITIGRNQPPRLERERAIGDVQHDAQFRQIAAQADEVRLPIKDTPVHHRAHFIHGIAKLRAAILDVQAGVGQRPDAPVDIGQLRHGVASS